MPKKDDSHHPGGDQGSITMRRRAEWEYLWHGI